VLIDEQLPEFDVTRIEHVVVEAPPQRTYEALLIGAVGRFWGRDVDWLEIDAADFRDFDRPGYGKVAAGFSVREYGEGRSLLSYEARTAATDESARRGFLRYWRLVGRGVGVVLRGTLRYIKGIAEDA
jgi:hypothetical protein